MNQLASGGGLREYGALGCATRATPAEDLIAAVAKLNAALSSAVKSGWIISLTVTDQHPPFAGEGAVLPVVQAQLQKQV